MTASELPKGRDNEDLVVEALGQNLTWVISSKLFSMVAEVSEQADQVVVVVRWVKT